MQNWQKYSDAIFSYYKHARRTNKICIKWNTIYIIKKRKTPYILYTYIYTHTPQHTDAGSVAYFVPYHNQTLFLYALGGLVWVEQISSTVTRVLHINSARERCLFKKIYINQRSLWRLKPKLSKQSTYICLFRQETCADSTQEKNCIKEKSSWRLLVLRAR